jgi:hypothetical protein
MFRWGVKKSNILVSTAQLKKDGGTENKHSFCNSVFATQLGNTVNSSAGVWQVFADRFNA